MVNYLLSERQPNFFSAGLRMNRREARKGRRLRTSFRLFRAPQYVESRLLLVHSFLTDSLDVRHSFERIIAGRSFVIEVTCVAEKRWRAHILRIPGVPTAMMPFYGETPDEAAAHLSDWLNRAHQHQANTV
jgi:hypothetical protein